MTIQEMENVFSKLNGKDPEDYEDIHDHLEDEDDVYNESAIVQEAKLSTKERNKLDDSEFGIPELRKYPLTDKKHVRSAVSYFHKAPRKYKVKLAKRILRAAHKYNMDTKDWDTINEYAHKKHIRVQEFVDPIAKLKDDVSGSMNFMNYLMKVDLLTKGSVSESLKQLKHSAPNGLHPIMFMGYMDPEGVNRSDLKDLEKQVIYADDENNIYSCFFNSHVRRHEISQIASSFETFINDLPKRKTSQPNIIKAYANPMIELKKDDRIIHSHHELPFTSLDNGSDGCYMNTYYSYFAILEAFEFKRNQLYHDICNVILDQFDGDENKFDFRSVEVKQVNWATAEILFRFKYDNDSFIVVIRTVSMKTQPAKLYHDNSPKNEDGDAYVGGDDFEEINHNDTNVENTEDEDASMTEMCIGSNEFGICYQEFDDNGKIKITNVPYNMMYFGSYKDFGNNMIKLQNPRLFVTPFKGIASIFTIDRSRYMIPRGKNYNLAYDEWRKDISQLDKPFNDVHVRVEGIPEMEHRSFENEGWIYGIDISDLKDHIYQEPWMDSEREFLILDVDEIPIAMKLNHKTVVYVEGADRNDVKEAPSNENVFYSNHRVPIDEKTVKKYMKKGNADLTIGLQHLHVNDKVTGYIWDTKDGNIVAYVAVEEKKDGNWIVALELSNKYQGKGYGKQLLDFAETELNADHLSVDKNNKHAIDLYSENGWETYKDSDSMLFMKKNTSDENIQEAAYTNEGINKANVRPVKIVYRRFSTKNDEQYEPIKKFWEISDKYFPKPNMTCGFGWDWTDDPDFAYGIIINEKEIPPEFMPELKSAFPDVVFDENFLIPKHYEKSFNCSLAKCQETYDEIWDKGPLTCELEEYPSDGQMKISVIYKKDKAELENELSEHIKTVKEDDKDTTVVDNSITTQETFFLDIQESLIPLKREGKEWEHSNGEYTFENENIHMRPATEDDIENMYQWEMESIDQSLADNEKVQSLIRQDCHDSLKDTLMIMDGDNIIGMFTACMIDNGEWRYIGEIYLIPEYRGQGIGSTILRNEMANYDKIRLQVAMDNEGAFKLYTSLGFKIAKEDDTNRMYIMEYVKPENIQETVTVDGHRLIELAYYKKITNLTPEQEQILQDYANARDQLQAAAAYYTRETKARKKSLKRMQLEHNTSKSEYQRDQLNRKMARTRIELDVLARDYAEAYQRNVQTMNELADKFDEIELSKKDHTEPSPMNDMKDTITIPIPKILRKPKELLGSFLKLEDEKDDTDV